LIEFATTLAVDVHLPWGFRQMQKIATSKTGSGFVREIPESVASAP
jgi:hypothetical protein